MVVVVVDGEKECQQTILRCDSVGRMEECRKSARVANGAEVSCMSEERRVIGKIKRGGANKESSELRGRGRVRQRMKRSRRYRRN